MPRGRLRIGTRGSRLAIAQTAIVVDWLRKAHARLEVETVTIRTLGDVTPPAGRRVSDGKSAFTGEIEKALQEGRVDAAVHSMKDLPGHLGEGLVLAAVPKRGDPRDAYVSLTGDTFDRAPSGAKVGTSSVRRRAQLLRMRPDVVVLELHGNVETRLRKLREEGLDGVVVAAAGLERLGIQEKVAGYFDTEDMVPAVGQGTLALEARKDDTRTCELLGAIDDPETRAATLCERKFSSVLGGDCDVPLAAYARVALDRVRAVGIVATPDGSKIVAGSSEGRSADAAALGARLADRLLSTGGREILEGLRP
jgi:hydroxymethylbilane synthase